MADLGLFATGADINQARDLAMAQMTPEQRMYAMGAGTGRALGAGLGSMFGVDTRDETTKKADLLRSLGSQFGTTSSEGLYKMAQALQARGQADLAMKVQAEAQKAEKQEASIASEKALTQQRLREKQAADPFQKLVETGKYTPASLAKYKETGNVADLVTIDKKEGTSEFERLVDGLPISDEEKSAMKRKRAMAMVSGDSSGLKAVQEELARARLDQITQKTDALRTKEEEAKTQAIQKLESSETALEDSLVTAGKALNLAPNSFVDASQQVLLGNIPWTDQKALKNLVSSLNSDKALSTLNELKSQSRTGATGFGALNTRELQLILDKTRALDPTDKMFKENLLYVMNGWNKIRQQAQESRLNLQGKGEQLKKLKSMISAARAKGSMTAAERDSIEALKNELGVR